MSGLDELLALQQLDTLIEQAERRWTQLPERTAAAAAARAVAEARAEIASLEQELATAEAGLAEVESATAAIDTKVATLQAKLRNVIAVREAEALQSEIAQLGTRRSDLDDRGLEELERIETILERLEAGRASLPDLEQVAAEAHRVLELAEAAVVAEIDQLRTDRAAQVAAVPAGLLSRYNSLRVAHGGVVVARLNGSRCEACHLDLSRSEVEQLRGIPADEPAECPSCSRLLVR